MQILKNSASRRNKKKDYENYDENATCVPLDVLHEFIFNIIVVFSDLQPGTKAYKTSRLAPWKAIGSVDSLKSGSKESNKKQVRSSQNKLRVKLHQDARKPVIRFCYKKTGIQCKTLAEIILIHAVSFIRMDSRTIAIKFVYLNQERHKNQ